MQRRLRFPLAECLSLPLTGIREPSLLRQSFGWPGGNTERVTEKSLQKKEARAFSWRRCLASVGLLPNQMQRRELRYSIRGDQDGKGHSADC